MRILSFFFFNFLFFLKKKQKKNFFFLWCVRTPKELFLADPLCLCSLDFDDINIQHNSVKNVFSQLSGAAWTSWGGPCLQFRDARLS
jgi:hypothetical protein